jgi:hypothetical protein
MKRAGWALVVWKCVAAATSRRMVAQAWVRNLREPHALIGEMMGVAQAAVLKPGRRWGRQFQGMEGSIASSARQ